MKFFADTRTKRHPAFVVLLVWLLALASSVANACFLDMDQPHSRAAQKSVATMLQAPAGAHAQGGADAGHHDGSDGTKESCLKVCEDGTQTLPKAYAGVDHNDPGPAPLVATLWYPNLDLLSHNSGHLWSTLLGEKGDPHFGALHIASYVFLCFGFYLLSSAWNVLYHAQRRKELAKSGPYARIRHSQYVPFVLILLGFLLQWPTLLTLVMFPILLVMYGRLAITEEAEMRKQFGGEFDAYEKRTPRFFPRLGASVAAEHRA